MRKPTFQTARPARPDSETGPPVDPGPPPTHHGRTYAVLTVVYLAFALCGSLVPFEFIHVPLDQAIEQFPRIDPLNVTLRSWSDLGANILLFIPLTFLAMGALTREGRRRGQWLVGAAVILAASALAAAVEFVQIYSLYRVTSQSDILAETSGGTIGVVLWFSSGRRVTERAREVWHAKTGNRVAARALVAYLLFVAVCLLFPFDMTLSLGQTYRKLKSWRVTLVPFTDLRQAWLFGAAWKAALMVPVGYLLLMLRSSDGPRRLLGAVGWGVVFAVAIETAQLFAGPRRVSTTDVIVYTAGILAGALAGLCFGPAARGPEDSDSAGAAA